MLTYSAAALHVTEKICGDVLLPAAIGYKMSQGQSTFEVVVQYTAIYVIFLCRI